MWMRTNLEVRMSGSDRGGGCRGARICGKWEGEQLPATWYRVAPGGVMAHACDACFYGVPHKAGV